MKTRSWRNKTVLLLLLEMIITTRCYSVGPALLYYYIKSAARMCRHVISWKQVHYLFGSCGRGDGSSFGFGKERNFYVRAVFYDTQFRTFFFFFLLLFTSPDDEIHLDGPVEFDHVDGHHTFYPRAISFSFFNDGDAISCAIRWERACTVCPGGSAFYYIKKIWMFLISLSRFTMCLYDGGSSLIRSKM